MFFEQTFTIYHDCGKVEFVTDLLTYMYGFGGSAKFFSCMKYNVSEFEKVRSLGHYYVHWYEESPRFFLCNEAGLMISPDLLYGEYQKWYNATYIKRWENRRVQALHNRRQNIGHTYSRYKTLSTVPALRASVGVVKEEGEPEFRRKRSIGYIPTFWDDIRTRRSSSWKSTKRKKQYKGS